MLLPKLKGELYELALCILTRVVCVLTHCRWVPSGVVGLYETRATVPAQ